MTWQQKLGVALGLLVVGPVVGGVVLGARAGWGELVLSGLLGAVVGRHVAGRLTPQSTRS